MKIQALDQKFQTLSPKQRKILILFLNYKKDQEISDITNISATTVRKHIQKLCDHFEIAKTLNGVTVKRRKILLELRKDLHPIIKNHEKSIDRFTNSDNSHIAANHYNSNGGIDRGLLTKRYMVNLPHQHNQFVGREEELKKLLKFISLNYRAPIISVTGIGGVGKTALVLEAAYRCLEAAATNNNSLEKYDSIIFTSAKKDNLLPQGIVNRPNNNSTKKEIFTVIANTLDDAKIKELDGEEQIQRIYDSLGKQKTLLIVDNMETLDDKEEIIEFLSNIPSTTKALITARERLVLYASIRLQSMTEEAAIKLVEQQCFEKDIELSEAQVNLLFERIGRIPIGIIYLIGQIASGKNINSILSQSSLPNDIGRFCFGHSLAIIRGQSAHKLLMSLALFNHGPYIDALANVSGLNQDTIALKEGLAKLQLLSLINLENERYRMLPLTREYSLSELSAYPDYHEEIRIRWIKWYQNYASKNGHRDWAEYHYKYDFLENELSNLVSVLDWCSRHNRYDDVKNLWSSLNQFASLYGHWPLRLQWLRWINNHALKLGDSNSACLAMADESYTLTQMRKLSNAQDRLTRCLAIRCQTTKNTQVHLAQNIALLRTYQQKYVKAFLWLNEVDRLIHVSSFSDRDRERRQIACLSLRGDVYIQLGDHNEALKIFLDVLDRSKNIKWQRRVNNTRRKIADIYILKKENLRDARILLKTGFVEVFRNKDKTNIAKYQRSWAYLEKTNGNMPKAHEWASQAMKNFQDLNMIADAENMKILWMET